MICTPSRYWEPSIYIGFPLVFQGKNYWPIAAVDKGAHIVTLKGLLYANGKSMLKIRDSARAPDAVGDISPAEDKSSNEGMVWSTPVPPRIQRPNLGERKAATAWGTGEGQHRAPRMRPRPAARLVQLVHAADPVDRILE